MEQEDNFFPQNETNAIVPRTFNVTVDGITKSCTINQGIIDYTKSIKLKTIDNVSQYAESLIYTGGIRTYDVYINNKKVITTYSSAVSCIKVNSIPNNADIEIIYLNSGVLNLQYAFYKNRISYSIYKEIDLSNITVNVLISNICGNQEYVTKVLLPQNVQNNNYEACVNGCSSLEEVICLSQQSPNTVTVMFAGVSTTGVLKYPAGVNYSAMIAVLPANWTYQEI
jgi:hypothetical protein